MHKRRNSDDNIRKLERKAFASSAGEHGWINDLTPRAVKLTPTGPSLQYPYTSIAVYGLEDIPAHEVPKYPATKEAVLSAIQEVFDYETQD